MLTPAFANYEREAIRKLPIFKSVAGGFTSIHNSSAFVLQLEERVDAPTATPGGNTSNFLSRLFGRSTRAPPAVDNGEAEAKSAADTPAPSSETDEPDVLLELLSHHAGWSNGSPPNSTTESSVGARGLQADNTSTAVVSDVFLKPLDEFDDIYSVRCLLHVVSPFSSVPLNRGSLSCVSTLKLPR